MQKYKISINSQSYVSNKHIDDMSWEDLGKTFCGNVRCEEIPETPKYGAKVYNFEENEDRSGEFICADPVHADKWILKYWDELKLVDAKDCEIIEE